MNTIKEKVLRMIFPEAGEIRHGGGEINGLPENTVPQNCTILQATPSPWNDDRTFYCVVYENPEYKIAINLRVCKAMEGSGYAEFVAVHHFDMLDIDSSNEKILKESYAFRITEL